MYIYICVCVYILYYIYIYIYAYVECGAGPAKASNKNFSLPGGLPEDCARAAVPWKPREDLDIFHSVLYIKVLI